MASPLSGAEQDAINQEIEEMWQQQQQQLRGQEPKEEEEPALLQLPAAGTKMLSEGDV